MVDAPDIICKLINPFTSNVALHLQQFGVKYAQEN